jgi:hypothetical protein
MDKVRDIFSYFVAALTLGTLFVIGALIVFLPRSSLSKRSASKRGFGRRSTRRLQYLNA